MKTLYSRLFLTFISVLIVGGLFYYKANNKNKLDSKEHNIDSLCSVAYANKNVNPALALKAVNSALKTNKISKYQEAKALNTRGVIYETKGNYLAAIEDLKAAGEYFKKDDDDAGQASVYNNFAILYKDIFSYSEAINYILKTKTIDSTNNDSISLLSDYINLSEVYLKENNPTLAFQYANNSDTLLGKLLASNKIENRSSYGVIFSNIGNYYFYRPKDKTAVQNSVDYDTAIAYYDTALLYLQNDSTTYCEATLGIAKSIFSKRVDFDAKINFDSCLYACSCFDFCSRLNFRSRIQPDSIIIKYAELSFSTARRGHFYDRVLDASKFLAKFYLADSELCKAAYYQLLSGRLTDSLYTSTTTKFVELTKEAKQREIDEHHQHELEHEQYLTLAAIALSLCIAFLVNLMSSYNRKNGPFLRYLGHKIWEMYSSIKINTCDYFKTMWKLKKMPRLMILAWGLLIFIIYELFIKLGEIIISKINDRFEEIGPNTKFAILFLIQLFIGSILVRLHHAMIHHTGFDQKMLETEEETEEEREEEEAGT